MPFFGGLAGRAVSTCIFYPFITMRVRIQQNQFIYLKENIEINTITPKYNKILTCFQKILKNEGFFGFYKGFYLNFMKSSFSKGTFFFFYEYFKIILKGKNKF